MKKEEVEDLFLRSLDSSLNEEEAQDLKRGMEQFPMLAKDLGQYTSLREAASRKSAATFGPYFAQKVVTRIQQGRVEIEAQIAIFFKRYQLAALGVIIALFAVNAMLSEQFDIPSLLGVEESTLPTTDDELLSFDFYESLSGNEK